MGDIGLYQGRTIGVCDAGEGFAELRFDRHGEAINKFDAATVRELKEAVAAIAAAAPRLRGVLVTSAKDVFVVGADINEFKAKFRLPHADLVADVRSSNEAFVALEDLQLPTVAAVDGYALGGGFEFLLACALRVMSERAQVGLPEVKLGLFPGFGGTVRLPRVAGIEAALAWIADGQPRTARQALAAQAADAVCAHYALRETALAWLREAADGAIDWRDRQQAKRLALQLPAPERGPRFARARLQLAQASAPHQPAALAALDLMERAAPLDRDAALLLESESFARIAHTQAAASLVQVFLSEQAVKKKLRRLARPDASRPGAGSDGPDPPAGLAAQLAGHGIGFHPVPPIGPVALVEVAGGEVAGSQAGAEALAAALAHARARKLSPVLVRDGPGRLVHRMLMALAGAALRLIAQGVDYRAIDAAMERFGWAAGPCALLDGVGIEASLRLAQTLLAQDPQRLPAAVPRILALLQAHARLGRASGRGFYRYEHQPLGAPARHVDDATATLLARVQDGAPCSLSDDDIVDRLMLPSIVEAARCLEEGVVATAAELDLAMLHGLGCPAHVGGPLTYADWLGLDEVIRRCDALRAHGGLYQASPRLRQLAAAGAHFHSQGDI